MPFLAPTLDNAVKNNALFTTQREFLLCGVPSGRFPDVKRHLVILKFYLFPVAGCPFLRQLLMMLIRSRPGDNTRFLSASSGGEESRPSK